MHLQITNGIMVTLRYSANRFNSEKADDGKSYVNPPAEKKSEAYKSFVSPITNGQRGGFE